MSTLGEKEIVIGTVTAMYQPGWSANGKLTPGKLVLDTDEGVCEVSFMQLYEDSVRTEKMPQIWNDIDEDEIRGRRVAISATFQRVYTNKETQVSKNNYGNPSSIKYLDGDAPTPKEATPEPTGEGASTPPPEQPRSFTTEERISWNSAINNANISLSNKWTGTQYADGSGSYGSIHDPESPAYMKKLRKSAMLFYEEIRRGPVEIVEEAVEPEPQDPDLESLESF